MYIPHSEDERKQMLKTIGVATLAELFSDVPEKFRFPQLNLPKGLCEMEAFEFVSGFSYENASCDDFVCFLGAGAYDHYIPAAVDAILRKGEFFTAYTPYQPEISQGTLQTIFEFQTLISNLTGMDVCNASHYDGATASAEACLTAYHHFKEKRSKFLLSPYVHPQYREVIKTYLSGIHNAEIIIGLKDKENKTSTESLKDQCNNETALVVVQYPDFLGRIFDYSDLIDSAHKSGSLVCVIVNPIALALLKPPGDFNADLVVGEGQPLGIPLSFGGPYLGFFATRKEMVRKMSGRLVGETVDAEGKRGYVLTLTAREQHIRREKATSNICTNQGLMTLAASTYLSLLGKNGLKQVAELCFHRAHYAAKAINNLSNYQVRFGDPFFHEFIIQCPKPVSEINEALLNEGIIGGYNLEIEYPEMKNCMLVAITEKINKSMIDLFCNLLEEISHD